MVTIALIFAILVKSINYSVYGAGEISSIWNIKTLIANFLLIFRGWPRMNMTGINNPTWYLCILIICYFLFHLCLFIQPNPYKRTILFVGIFVLAFLANYKGALDSYTFRGLECFFLGAAMCDFFEFAVDREFARKIPFKIGAIVVSGIFISISIVLIFTKFLDNTNWQRRLSIFGIFVWLVFLSYLFRDKQNAVIRSVGKISFEVYVWHVPFLALAKLLMNVIGLSFEHSFWTMLAFALIVWGVSIPLWRFVERPLGRLIKRLDNPVALTERASS